MYGSVVEGQNDFCLRHYVTSSVNSPQHRYYPTLVEKRVGSFKFLLPPPENVKTVDQRLNVSVLKRYGKRMLPKVQPSTKPGIEPGTFWLVVGDLYQLCKPRTHGYRRSRHKAPSISLIKLYYLSSLWANLYLRDLLL